MIRSLYRKPEGNFRTDLSPAEFAACLNESGGLLWVDFQAEPPENCEPILRDTFAFHPLAIDDALREQHVPRVDDWGPYLYVVLMAVKLENVKQDSHEGPEVTQTEVDVFLGANYIVTHHDEPAEAVDRVWHACQRDERHTTSGPDHLLYEIADHLVAAYMRFVEEMDEAIDEIEDRVFENPTSETLARIFTLKRAILHLRRVISPQREVLNRLARDDYPVIDARDRVYFRDVYDHLVRLHDINEGLRDLVGGALDTYLSVINNRMNEVMKTLTLITTLFMPLTFVTGFFGMNFFQPVAQLTAWTDRPALAFLLTGVVLIPAGMYLWMRKRRWA